jgi:hypothetical protein
MSTTYLAQTAPIGELRLGRRGDPKTCRDVERVGAAVGRDGDDQYGEHDGHRHQALVEAATDMA